MKSMIRNSMIVAALVFATVSQAATWKFDTAHSGVSFSVKHMMMTTVRGDFTVFDGTATFDEGKPEALAVEATADAASITTRNEKRDTHLKSPDFFDAEKYPKLTFKSKSVQRVGDDRYQLVGDFTIRDVTKEVTFDVTGLSGTMKDPWGSTRTSAVATVTIDRTDFGLNWNKALEAGGVLVSNFVTITLDLALVKQPEN